ncbi:MAG: thiol reductase thioredoxin [Polaromonas sp.]|nr:thiol reductase thioredoxin [Polaromonas sp.]
MATRKELTEVLLLEFGTDWCGFCLSSTPIVTMALAAHPAVQHLKIEDGARPDARPIIPGQAVAVTDFPGRWPGSGPWLTTITLAG